MKKNPAVFALVLLTIMFLLPGCLRKMQQSPTAPTEQYPIVRTVIVLPVETLVSSDDQTNLNEAQKLARGAETMNRLLADYFAEMDSVKVITAEQKKVLVSNYKASRSAQAREIGQQLKSDAILLTTINRYTERQGNEYSVHQPASVAFDFKLMATESGRTICSGFFDESQKSLFENLFSFSGAMRRKFKWITASDLAAEGIRKRFDACPQLHQP